MTRNFEDLFGGRPAAPGTDALMDLLKGRTPTRPNDTTRNRAANRQECQAKGHKYQVHGKTNPSKIVCARCEVSWAIGPRTEPPA